MKHTPWNTQQGKQTHETHTLEYTIRQTNTRNTQYGTLIIELTAWNTKLSNTRNGT